MASGKAFRALRDRLRRAVTVDPIEADYRFTGEVDESDAYLWQLTFERRRRQARGGINI